MNEDKDRIDKVLNFGISTLPDKYRQQITSIFNNPEAKDKWFTPEMFEQALGVSRAYSRKVCEVLTLTRVVEKRQAGKQCFYRVRIEERFGQ